MEIGHDPNSFPTELVRWRIYKEVRNMKNMFVTRYEGKPILTQDEIPERFGLVMAESMAAGVPVIAMDLGSCREVIADKQTGYLVDSVDEAVEAVGNIGKIDRKKCRQRVEENFTIDKMVSGYEKVYEEVFLREAKKK